jgi:hypothetical protein
MIMLQQLIALMVILFFVARLFFLRKKNSLPSGEFAFWLVFWSLSAASVLSLKWLDRLFAGLGFSASAINILVYIAVIALFYLNFMLRLKMERVDRALTAISRKVALDEAEKK